MTRPSNNTDQLLIDAGRTLALRHGLSGLTVRDVAAEAGVNLGMFHYHFKTKERFHQEILKKIYADFFEQFTLETSASGLVLERLERALVLLGKFTRDHRDIILSLIHDVMGRQKSTTQFLRENFFKHGDVLIGLVKEAQNKGIFRKMPIPLAMSFLGSTVGIPSLVFALVCRSGVKRPLGFHPDELEVMMLSDNAIQLRIDMAIKGMKIK